MMRLKVARFRPFLLIVAVSLAAHGFLPTFGQGQSLHVSTSYGLERIRDHESGQRADIRFAMRLSSGIELGFGGSVTFVDVLRHPSCPDGMGTRWGDCRPTSSVQPFYSSAYFEPRWYKDVGRMSPYLAARVSQVLQHHDLSRWGVAWGAGAGVELPVLAELALNLSVLVDEVIMADAGFSSPTGWRSPRLTMHAGFGLGF